MKSRTVRWSIILALFCLALGWNYWAGNAYAKLPIDKTHSCENKAIYVLQVIHAKKSGYTLDWIISSVTEANKEYADPEVKTEELVTVARWAYGYKGSEESAIQEYFERCVNPSTV